jgi:hypothetical protein
LAGRKRIPEIGSSGSRFPGSLAWRRRLIPFLVLFFLKKSSGCRVLRFRRMVLVAISRLNLEVVLLVPFTEF